MFDSDLVFDKLNSLHQQAQNLLFRFKAWVIERGADIRPFGRILEETHG